MDESLLLVVLQVQQSDGELVSQEVAHSNLLLSVNEVLHFEVDEGEHRDCFLAVFQLLGRLEQLVPLPHLWSQSAELFNSHGLPRMSLQLPDPLIVQVGNLEEGFV